jgi:hypothetical protein
MDIKDIVDLVFNKPPQPPLTYRLIPIDPDQLSDVVSDYGSDWESDPMSSAEAEDSSEDVLFPILINVLIYGAKRLYGDDIKPELITTHQFALLNDYMMSIGFVIQYDHTYDDEGDPTAINIWFDAY